MPTPNPISKETQDGFLYPFLETYLQSDIETSLKNNRHMHNWTGSNANLALEDIKVLLTSLVKETEGGAPLAIDVVQNLTTTAQALAKRELGNPLPKDLVKAILVNFINDLAGTRWCIDYGLYACDL